MRKLTNTFAILFIITGLFGVIYTINDIDKRLLKSTNEPSLIMLGIQLKGDTLVKDSLTNKIISKDTGRIIRIDSQTVKKSMDTTITNLKTILKVQDKIETKEELLKELRSKRKKLISEL